MLACKHEREPFGSPMCIHLQMHRKPWIDYVKWYTGIGMNTDLLCVPCVERRKQQLDVQVDGVCQECFEYATTELFNRAGVAGRPEIRERSEPCNATLKDIVLTKELGTVIDIAPVNASSKSVWLLLAEGGRVFRLDCETRDSIEVARASVREEPEHKSYGEALKPRLHASTTGEFVAVVNDYGQYGQVIDLRSGEITMELDGGEYYPGTVPFSFAFADLNQRVVAIHRTLWNRLDLSDPENGKLLSQRGPLTYRAGEALPEHHLDYFHGALYVSPQSTRILDDGWVWHPMGIPAVWSLEPWLSDNEWESEDGPTRTNLCARAYYWDKGMAWLDDSRIAIAGIGDDDEDMIEGARVFDATAREITSFAGPAGLFFSDGVSLFSSDESGLSRWDVMDGVRTGQLKDFQPTHHHRGANELAQLKEGVLRLWSTLN